MTDPDTQPPVRGLMHRLIVGSIIALMVATGATAFLAVYFHRDLRRWVFVGKITSNDPQQQGRGLGYVVHNLNSLKPDDPLRDRLLADVRRLLDRENDQVFGRLVAGLSEGGIWGRDFHPPAWIRYLTGRVDQLRPEQRVNVAVELGRMLWNDRSIGQQGSVIEAVARLLEDTDDNVRFNALSTAACLPDPRRAEMIRSRTTDTHPVIARHAWIMTGLLKPPGVFDKEADPAVPAEEDALVAMARRFARSRILGEELPVPLKPAPDASEVVQKLADLEARPPRSDDLEFNDEMPDLIRLQTARVSRLAKPDDLANVFNSANPTTRDLACVMALDRFGPEVCVELARQLAMSFYDNQRMSGAILAGMVQPDESLRKILKLRLSQNNLGWVVDRHFSLTMWLLGEKVVDHVEAEDGSDREVPFDPAILLQQPRMPRTTVTLALLHGGRLEGADYYLNPFGQPPVALELLLDQLRYETVLRRYLPQMPEFWEWGTVEQQRFQIEVIRDWYLLFRMDLKFDAEKKVFFMADRPA